MASSILVYNLVFLFLLVSVLLVSASTDHKTIIRSVLPSLEGVALTGSYVCDPKVDVYTTQVWGPTKDCIICTAYCYGACDALRTKSLDIKCTPRPPGPNLRCECCCKRPSSPPPPPCPPPAPRPPPPPPCSPPTPSGDQCRTGDTYTETTMPTSNCADCTNWCKEDCSELGGRVVEDKCAIGESKFIRRCKCCCRGGKSGAKLY